MFIATLIADDRFDWATASEWAHQFDSDWTAGSMTDLTWIDDGHAVDLRFEPAMGFDLDKGAELASGLADLAARIAQRGDKAAAFDVIVQRAADREKRLLIADMDSTMITVECIDELADYAGIKPQIAAVTEAAMRGELDFAAALDARVALLAGLEEGAIDRCLAERVRDSDGAATLIRTLGAHGVRTVLVSGGFTRFAEPVGARLGFDRVVANRLEIADSHLTGRVERPIVDADTKLATLRTEADALAIPLTATIAIGDGANDLPMIRAAGLGVAYRAKPVVAAEAGARLDHAPLSHLLYAMGIPRSDWVIA